MKRRGLFHRILSSLTLLALLLPMSPVPSSSARQGSRELSLVPERSVIPGARVTKRSVDEAADLTAPAPVVNLTAATGGAPGTVELSWTAPGDDATAGTASTYIVRYNTKVITETNWSSSSDVTGEPSPSAAGTVESMTVTGLAPGGTYYFAIKTEDEVPNVSAISNSPSAAAQFSSNVVHLPLVVSNASGVPTVIPETTEVLTETTTQHLSEVSVDQAVFTFTQSTASLDALETGDVMVGDATANAPNGFLRKVISVTPGADQVVVETEQATLEDAIESGEAHVSHVLTPNQVQSSEQLQGVDLMSVPELDDEFRWELDDVVLYDHDGDPETEGDQIVAGGSIRMKPSFEFDLVVRDWTVEELSFVANTVETTDLEIGGEVELLSIEEEKEIARHTLAPITVPIPPSPFPIVIVPVLTVHVGVDGSVHVGVSTGVTQEAKLAAGIAYADEDWRVIRDFSNEFHYTPPTLSAGLDLKGYAGAQLSLMLYGVTGPYAELEAYLQLQADVMADPWWTLWAGLDVPLGVKVEVLGHTLVETETVPIAYRLELARATSNSPPNMPSTPSPADGAANQSVNADLTWSGDDLDGDAVTYDVYFEADDTTPDTLVSEGQIALTYDPGTLAKSTDYYWRIVARDEHGATSAGPVWHFTTSTSIISGALLVEHLASGATVDIAGIVADADYGAVNQEGYAVWEKPLEGLLGGGGALATLDVTIEYSISPSGDFYVGSVGPPSDALAVLVGHNEWLARNLSLRDIRLYGLLREEYNRLATDGYVSGGDGLGGPVDIQNNYGETVYVMYSAVIMMASYNGEWKYADRLDVWDPSGPGETTYTGDTWRNFDLSCSENSHVFLYSRVHNDNGNSSYVRYDDTTVASRGTSIGSDDHVQLGSCPASIELGGNRTWSELDSSVHIAVVGGSMSSSNHAEYPTNGGNPSPSALTIPPTGKAEAEITLR